MSKHLFRTNYRRRMRAGVFLSVIRAWCFIVVLLSTINGVLAQDGADALDVIEDDWAPTGAIRISSRKLESIGKVWPLAGARVGEEAVSWRKLYPTPRHQGELNSCVPFAVCYAAKTFLERKRRGWPNDDDESRMFSPTWTYGQFERRQRPGRSSRGLLIQSVLAHLEGGGCITLDKMPYDGINLIISNDDDVWAEARKYKNDKWDTIDVTDVDTLKGYLAAGHAIVFGAGVDTRSVDGVIQGWDTDEAGVTTSMRKGKSYHCMALVGYDENKGDGAFEIMNSWGSNWMDGGFAWVSFEFWSEWAHEGYVIWESKEKRSNREWLPEGLSFNELKVVPPGREGIYNGNWGYPEDVDLKQLRLVGGDKIPREIKALVGGNAFSASAD